MTSFAKTAALAAALMIGGVGTAAAAEPSRACDLTVMISGAFTPPYEVLAPAFEASRGKTLCTVQGPSIGDIPTAIPNRLLHGEDADVVILVRASLDDLVARGRVARGSAVDLVDSRMGIAVRKGAPKPDISTSDAFRQTLVNAKSIVYSISASGVYLTTEVFPKLGIADQMKPKSRMMNGTPVAIEVAAGRAELGFQQISELMPIEGAELVGPIPAPWQRITVFSAGIAAKAKHPAEAAALIGRLTSPDVWPVLRKAGLEPSAASKK